MANGLQNTLTGTNVQTGFESALGDLPPDALEAARALMSLSSFPTPAETEQGATLAAEQFAPVNAILQNAPEPTPIPIPSADPFNTFLGLLAANLGAALAQNPNVAAPTMQTFAAQQARARAFEEFNIKQNAEFREKQITRQLESALAQSKRAADLALEAGDDRMATQKALQTARLEDALSRRRQRERIAQTGQENRATLGTRAKLFPKGKTGTTDSFGRTPEILPSQFNDDILAVLKEERTLLGARPPLNTLASPEEQQQSAIALRQLQNTRLRPLRQRRLDLALQRQPEDTPESMLARTLSVVPDLATKSEEDPELQRIFRVIALKFPAGAEQQELIEPEDE